MVQNVIWEETNNKEFHFGDNIIKILDDSIVYIEVVGEQTDIHASIIRNNYKKLLLLSNGRMKQLVNLNRSGKSSPAARAVFKDLNDENISEKVAVFGIHPVAKVLATFVMGLSMQKNIRYFSNEAEALAWLKE